MQNQWDPWACFPATRWSHLGVMGDSDTWSVLLMSSLLRKMQLVTCHSLIGFWYESASNWFIIVSVQSNLSANDNLYLQPSPALASPPQLHLRSSGIRFSQGASNLDPSHVQFTVGFALLWESNAATDMTGGGAQAVMGVIGSRKWSFAPLPTAQLLLCGPVPYRPQTDAGPWPGGWGPLE